MQSTHKSIINKNNAKAYIHVKNNYEDGYDENKEVQKEQSPFKKVLIASAIALGGITAYKSGALKAPLSKAIEYASNHSFKKGIEISQFKEWINISSR